jgi:amino acid permease
VIILGIVLIPLIIKKELQELKIISWFLFIAIFSFIILTISQLISHGIKYFNHDFADSDFEVLHGDYLLPKFTNVEIIKGLSIVLVAYSCQQNLFPIFGELENKTNAECVGAFSIATSMVGSLYVTLAVLSIYMFGSLVHSSILEDVADECSNDECPWESIVLRFLFLIVVACHIPFIFFSGKEGTLIIIDEINRRSISKALEMKLQGIEEDKQ